MSAVASPRVRLRFPAGTALVLLGLLAALAAAVAAGWATGVDGYATAHLMPGLSATGWNRTRLVNRIAAALTRPAYVAESLVLAAILVAVSWRRRNVVWLVALAIALVVEVLTKSMLQRPELTTPGPFGPFPLPKFDSSFPSGEAARTVVLAGCCAEILPMVRVAAWLWAAAVAVSLVAAGTHTPSDVLGGLLLGGALVVLCRSYVRRVA